MNPENSDSENENNNEEPLASPASDSDTSEVSTSKSAASNSENELEAESDFGLKKGVEPENSSESKKFPESEKRADTPIYLNVEMSAEPVNPAEKTAYPNPGKLSSEIPVSGTPGAGRPETPGARTPKKKKRNHLSYIALVFGLLLIVGFSILAIFSGLGFGTDLGSSDRVAVIYVQGTMLTGNIPSGFGYATSEEISEKLREALEDEQVKAIVLRINSGGGSPAAAQEIIQEIRKVQAEGIPVVVSMGDVAASAAYYIAAPSDYIMASPSTTTGSIGVIWVFQNMSAFYEEEGVDFYIAKSGKFKDMGGSWRGLTEEEKEYADLVILETYNDFIDGVAEGRNLSKSDVKSLADGRVYTGIRAKELGLVDGFGNLYDAIDKAAELAELEEEPRVVYMNRASLSRLFLGSESKGAFQSVNQLAKYYEESPYGKILA